MISERWSRAVVVETRMGSGPCTKWKSGPASLPRIVRNTAERSARSPAAAAGMRAHLEYVVEVDHPLHLPPRRMAHLSHSSLDRPRIRRTRLIQINAGPSDSRAVKA